MMLGCWRWLARRREGRGVVVLLVLGVCGGCDESMLPIPVLVPWTRHTIDDQFRGADGAKLGDANGDGLVDLVVGWEESGVVVVYLNPGPAEVGGRWPGVTVGSVGDVEDAVFVDLDGDGGVDVVSCCEGTVRSMFVHWAPADASEYGDAGAWRVEVLPGTVGQRQWMFCEPAQIDGRHGVDLVAGAKGEDGQIGYLVAPENPRELSGWTWQPLAEASWIMSIIPVDLDSDGDVDIVYTDRKGAERGAYWLENLGGGAVALWARHRIRSTEAEAMFAGLVDLDGDGWADLVVATDGRELLWLEPMGGLRLPWFARTIEISGSFGTGKGVGLGDVDADGSVDIVFSCENAGGKAGVGWLSPWGSGGSGMWNEGRISGTAGSKFDLVQLVDVDADGDLDVVTTEESSGLGVVWYENPGGTQGS